MPGVMLPPPGATPSSHLGWLPLLLLIACTLLTAALLIGYTCVFTVRRQAKRLRRRFAEAASRLDFNEAELCARMFLHGGRLN